MGSAPARGRRRSTCATATPPRRRTSRCWRRSTPPSAPSSPSPEAAHPSTSPTSPPRASSRVSSSSTTTASTGGFPMDNFALLFPNRSNYIHWIDDLLSSDLVPPISSSSETVRGFDIGTDANCIYPLLGASLLGWNFVGSDVADVALEWAKKNVESNPHLADLIEIRNANELPCSSKSETVTGEAVRENALEPVDDVVRSKPHILVGVVKDSESFDFCMCNPPFFESIEEAGLNPKTSCGGTAEEMVCPGGEQAFITHIIEDSVSLKDSFRWFTSMVGRKANLKLLVSKVRDAGASVVKTTEFVQGQTARWGLAWSFIAPRKMVIKSITPGKVHHSFMLQGLRREYGGAFQVLKSAETFFCASNLLCKTDSLSFSIDVTLSDEQTQAAILHGDDFSGSVEDSSTKRHSTVKGISFRISVFEQMPGTLLIRGSLLNKALSGTFSSLFSRLEDTLKVEFNSKAR